MKSAQKNIPILVFLIKTAAFTLAEILIVLGIIGIIAEMTIPTLIANTQKIQYVTALKKTYSEFNQVLISLAADNGCTGDLKCTGLFAEDTSNESLGDVLVKYFRTVKNCRSNSDGGAATSGCFSNDVYINYDKSGGAAGKDSGLDSLYNYRFITSDGVAFVINNSSNNFADSDSNGVTNNMTQHAGSVYIDVNGPIKGPNAVGRDIFFFYITNGKGPLLYPYGGADDGYWGVWRDSDGKMIGCIPTAPAGDICAGRVMEEEWTMQY